ncbi:MAG: hypothetical protein ACYCZO_05015 [Daejeonella sp.]
MSPYHDFPMGLSSSMVSFTGSISWMLYLLWPLFVTAINFCDGETWIFKGRSPKGKDRPVGLNDQPLGKSTLEGFELSGTVWALSPLMKNRNPDITERKNTGICLILKSCIINHLVLNGNAVK